MSEGKKGAEACGQEGYYVWARGVYLKIHFMRRPMADWGYYPASGVFLETWRRRNTRNLSRGTSP